MTDRGLADALQQVSALETACRTAVAEADGDERAAALATVRQVVPVKLAIERWILLRAVRVALQ